MKPGPQGWFKRPCLRVSMGNNDQVDDFPAEVATGLLRAHAKSQENIPNKKDYFQNLVRFLVNLKLELEPQ